MITTFAPVKFSPSPPALVDTKHREMLGSTLNSLTRRVLSAGLVDPSKRLYTIPLLITNSSKMSRSWKETDIVFNDSVSPDKLILKSMVRNLAKCKSTKFFFNFKDEYLTTNRIFAESLSSGLFRPSLNVTLRNLWNLVRNSEYGLQFSVLACFCYWTVCMVKLKKANKTKTSFTTGIALYLRSPWLYILQL